MQLIEEEDCSESAEKMSVGMALLIISKMTQIHVVMRDFIVDEMSFIYIPPITHERHVHGWTLEKSPSTHSRHVFSV